MDSSSEPLGGGEDEGLEEGEVEGETLLIVESEDQGSVDLSHDQSGDSLTSELEEGGGLRGDELPLRPLPQVDPRSPAEGGAAELPEGR
ncbi:hypothetical protein OYC64_016199 [Pagothenia borchgrevinki]|uniref:Uncharacterized protein n=1 Tax=Pagothenia borchgrevinki TaxID=8213 RepID=A0ABD2HIX1_PAGBO